jgi:hypothetical protein
VECPCCWIFTPVINRNTDLLYTNIYYNQNTENTIKIVKIVTIQFPTEEFQEFLEFQREFQEFRGVLAAESEIPGIRYRSVNAVLKVSILKGWYFTIRKDSCTTVDFQSTKEQYKQ